jgi:hypothetical protein
MLALLFTLLWAAAAVALFVLVEPQKDIQHYQPIKIISLVFMILALLAAAVSLFLAFTPSNDDALERDIDALEKQMAALH